MSFVKEFLTPVFIMCCGVGFVMWIIWLIWSGFKKMVKHPTLWWRYKVRNKWDEGKVKFCYDALDKEIPVEEIQKAMMVEGKKMSYIEDICYLYNLLKEKAEKEVKK